MNGAKEIPLMIYVPLGYDTPRGFLFCNNPFLSCYNHMTEDEKLEYRNLKYVRAEQGYWTTEEQERWNHLHQLQGQEVMKGLKALEEKRLMMLN